MQAALTGTCSRGLSDSVRVQTSTPKRALQNQRVLQNKTQGMAKTAPTACPCVQHEAHLILDLRQTLWYRGDDHTKRSGQQTCRQT